MSDVPEQIEEQATEEGESQLEAALDEPGFGMLVVVKDPERVGAFLNEFPDPEMNLWNGGETPMPTRFSGRGIVFLPDGLHVTADLVRSGVIIAGKTILSAEPGDSSDTVDVPFDASNPWRGNPEVFTYRPPVGADPEEPEHPHLLKVDFTVRYSGTLMWERAEQKITTRVRYRWAFNDEALSLGGDATGFDPGANISIHLP